jgi:K+-transporting ATPase KdpF subunit
LGQRYSPALVNWRVEIVYRRATWLTGSRVHSEICDARFDNAFLHGGFLWRSVPLRQGLPEVEVAMDLITIVALTLSVLLLGYLAYSLLYPEKF